ncbi:O-antigen ligase family protein [Patescibacteria group bacterium]|nr:O-antigen ligase family protein [Patescibacteria group bacterium]
MDSIIRWSYNLLFLLTPLLFSSHNSELFELPKMYFVYSLTIIIATFHLLSYLKAKAPLLPQKYITLPLFIFLLSQAVSTFYSIDRHTSIFGYYSRLNGGLLSLVCYSLLSLILAIYINPKFRQQIIKSFLLAGFLVSTYAVAQHFGIDSHLWVQDVQNRVFSTLGQPNWLSAYLAILLPFSLYYLFAHPKKYFFYLLPPLYFLALLFTKSKSGLIATFISLAFYFSFLLVKHHFKFSKNIIIFSLIFLTFSLLIKNPIKDTLFPPPLEIKNLKLEINNVTPSQDIRKIVWQGAISLWRQFPLFGTGVETFAYSYYWVRPVSHNLTSEWEFLYNKAHNEYLNFLATTGTFGLLTYLFLLFSIFKKLFKNLFYYPACPPLAETACPCHPEFISGSLPLRFRVKPGMTIKTQNGISLAILASIISILITNFAGFSVVIVNLYLFLLPALIHRTKSSPPTKTFHLPKIFFLLPIFFSLFLLSKNFRFYLADIAYAKSDLDSALRLRPQEPLYLSQSSLALANLAQDSSSPDPLIQKAISQSDKAITSSPANINFWRERAQMYYLLSVIDKKYFIKAINSLNQAANLAPTDPKNFYLLGRFLQTADLNDQAIAFYQQAIDLKNNYDHAYFALGQIYFQQKNYSQAQNSFQKALDINPKNTEAQDYLNQIETLL